jgi:capsular exopolysaccharide synthesis family protein
MAALEPEASSATAESPTPPTAETEIEMPSVSVRLAAAEEQTRAARPSIAGATPPAPIRRNGRVGPYGEAAVDDRLVSLLDANAFEAEQYRALRHAVEQAHKRARLSVVAISSPAIGDGKTTTAINLAGALAQGANVRVLLIDADLRRPSIASRLGIVGRLGPTLADLVLDPVLSIDEVACYWPAFNLHVIPAGSKSPNSYELFKAPRLGEILTEARTHFDYVILDTAPLVHVLDSRVISRWVDGYLIVVTCHGTSRKVLAEALDLMEPEKILGLVFNGDDRPTSGSRHYHYAYSRRRGAKASPLTRILRSTRSDT